MSENTILTTGVLKEKERICDLLATLKAKAESNEDRILDDTLPSINIWIFYCEYFEAVRCIFSLEDDPKDFESLFDVLELDDFFISAKEDTMTSKRKITDYVQRMEKKFHGTPSNR